LLFIVVALALVILGSKHLTEADDHQHEK
jgi:Sec-independent protein translocase protein TatA